MAIDEIGSHHVPVADSSQNEQMTQVIGNKTDTALTAYTAADSLMRYIKGLLDLMSPTAVGAKQMIGMTIDLNQVAGSYTILTGTAQDVVLESILIRMSGGPVGGAVTSISIQTNDATPQVYIDAVTGAVANLTNEAQLAWVGSSMIPNGVLIQLTIAGGAAGVAKVCDVVATYRAVVAGGYLA